MDTLQIPVGTETYAYLEDVSWDDYETLLEAIGERPIRCTYDEGRLEIMTLSHEHEFESRVLGRLVGILVAMLRIRMRTGGSNTMKRALLDKGLEPDECFWIQHEERMRHKKKLNLDVDLPPDLVIEVDVSRSVMNRMKIYAALRVPEVWRWRKGKLVVNLLSDDGRYQVSDRSAAFPFLPMGQFQRLLDKLEVLDETEVVCEFMEWVEQDIKPKVNGGRKNGKRAK